MRLKSLQIRNILSVEEINLQFHDSGLLLLDGWNHDDNTANGAGKTSIWNALSFGLYGKLPRKVTVSELVRRGTKKGSVKIELEADGKFIVIERHRPKKEIFTVDGEEIPAQEELEKYLKLTYRQFLMCMYASQTGQSKFIELTDSDKKDFFLNLLNLSQFDDVKGVIDDKVSSLQSGIIELGNGLDKCDVRISTYRESLEDEDLLKIELAKLGTEDLENKLNGIDIDKPDVSKFDDLKFNLSEKLDLLRSEIANMKVYRNKVDEIDRQISHLEENLTSEDNITCPHCSKGFILAGENSLTIEQLTDRINVKIKKLQEARKNHVNKINDSDVNTSKVESIQELIRKTVRKKDEALSTYLKNKEQYTEIRSAIQVRQSKASGIKKRLEDMQEVEKKIALVENQKVEISEKLEKYKNDLTICKTLSNIFSSTGAQAYVMDNVIDLFNQRVSDYVAMIWPNATYMLLSYKENKSGGIKAKLSDKLVIAGKEVSLGSLSGGELRCLSLSIDFAVIEILELMTGVQINPYILDEPFEGLDAANRERAVSMLEKISQDRQVWVIDHQSEAKAMFSDIVKVEKRNGVSSIV